ncbi:hypothetical protein L1987_83652 [Smallanthus sonchifolius]|uniref:Uncharacterized protein n=1 Tax=Smallanthus sonchifolius TaxID=185202 RepID=A0ACB8YD74_9ASTR|nr:hypothetical protein L1987_83652 [Smallanthus sonchifolius]
MALYNPPPPLLTTDTTIYNNGGAASSNIASPQQYHYSSSSTSTSSSIIIVIIVIASAIIISASIYLLLRFLSRRCSRSVRSFSPPDDVVVSDRRNENENESNNHVICFDSNKVESLPLFTFSSLTGEISGGDCAVCLSKFEAVDQLRLLPLCCHAFHAECIDAWLKSNLTCPLCRSTVNPTDDDVLNKILSVTDRTGGTGGGDRNNSFRIEIGSVSRRRTPSDSGRRSYSIGSYEYVLDDGYEVPVESTHRREISADKDSTTPEPPGESLTAEIANGDGSGRLNWLRDYVDRVSVSISSRSHSFRGSGRFFTGSSRRSETVDDFEATHGRVGEEISELFRWLSGV